MSFVSDIKNRASKVKNPQTNGFIERFHRTVLDEFFRIIFRKTQIESVTVLQKELDKWLTFYIKQRPHQGDRNMDKKPIETLTKFVHNESRIYK